MISIPDDKKFTEKTASVLMIMTLIIGGVIGYNIGYYYGYNGGFDFRGTVEPHDFSECVTDEGRAIRVDWDTLDERVNLHKQALEHKYNTSIGVVQTECEGDMSYYGMYGKYCTTVFSINDTFNVIYLIEKSEVEDLTYVGGD